MSKQGSLFKVWETKALTQFSKANEAKQLLEKLAAAVGPVMERRKWKVPVLKEFFPKNDGLLGLNVNKGASILVRLRPPHCPEDFFPWEHILGTMIHELTHIEISPHSADFYKLMDEIADEVEADILNGRTGSISSTMSFTGTSHKLNEGKIVVQPRKDELARKAAEAAIKRVTHRNLVAGSGNKLGGEKISNLSREELRQRAAAAAQRRLDDDSSCPTRDVSKQVKSNASSGRSWSCNLCETKNPHSVDNCSFCSSERIGPSSGSDAMEIQVVDNSFPQQQSGADTSLKGQPVKSIDLIDDGTTKPGTFWDKDVCGMCETTSKKTVENTSKTERAVPSALRSTSSATLLDLTGRSCDFCTYINDPTNIVCDMCNNGLDQVMKGSNVIDVDTLTKPSREAEARGLGPVIEESSSSSSSSSSKRWKGDKSWHCRECTYVNSTSFHPTNRCEMCDTPAIPFPSSSTLTNDSDAERKNGGASRKTNSRASQCLSFDPFKPSFN